MRRSFARIDSLQRLAARFSLRQLHLRQARFAVLNALRLDRNGVAASGGPHSSPATRRYFTGAPQSGRMAMRLAPVGG
jgi:hypothetical protein